MIDLGPGAGINGGNVVFEGTVDQILNGHKSVTGDYLKDNSLIKLENKKRNNSRKTCCIKGASENNLKNIDVEIPLGLFVTITGVSGSGKSTLINEILLKISRESFLQNYMLSPGKHKKLLD